MVNGEQVLLLRIYPQNVHQPWPLALKFLGGGWKKSYHIYILC